MGPRIHAWARRHPWRFTPCFTAAVFLVASFVPIWSALHIGPLEITGGRATFWQMAASLFGAPRRLAVDHFGTEALKLAGLIIVAGIVGRLIAGNPDSPEAADYDDEAPR